MTRSGAEIRRLDLGYFVRPASETGGEHPRVEPVYGYLVRRDEGLLLFDTGIGAADPETEAHYRPRRRPLAEALAAAGVRAEEIALVVNCHLHFDHCGENPRFAGTPIVVQRRELATARGADYIFPELVDFPSARYEQLDGAAELWPGVLVLPTAGHSAGHQSLAVRQPDGTVLLAGQARDTASIFAADVLARRAAAEGVAAPLPPVPPWLSQILDLDPARVLFAHDGSVWEPVSR
ncbi:N-acyl homoserine lactonase family protein [Micromonospora sp. NPDC049559]|uniref:N-acyl homoserine lactonase family protein n=1 Tax=Micromonospora sp. NPDC049559 TaxID=3155923 RepID=UPI00342F8551